MYRRYRPLSAYQLIVTDTSLRPPALTITLTLTITLNQCRIKVGAIDAAALGPFKKIGPRSRTRKREKSTLHFGCDFSGWYNAGKNITTVAIRCHILKLKCTKFDFGWCSAPDPTGAAYSAPPDPLAGFKGTYFQGEKGKGLRRGRKDTA